MSDRIQYLDLPGIFGAIQQIQGGQQRSRLLELQSQMEQQKYAAVQKQLANQQAYGASLPADQQSLFQADPGGYIGSVFERMKPGKPHAVTEGGALVNENGQVVYERPKSDGVTWGDNPVAPPSPSANLQRAGATAPPIPITPNYASNLKVGENNTTNPAAKNSNSTATGDHQFIEETWLDQIATHRPDLAQGKTREQILALREQPEISAEMANNYARDNAAVLDHAGFESTPTNLAILHRFGPSGGMRILQAEKVNPNARLDTVLSPAAVNANPHLRGMTIAQGRAQLDGHMKEAGQGSVGRSEGGATPPQATDSDWQTGLQQGKPYTKDAEPGKQWARRQNGVNAAGQPVYEYKQVPIPGAKEEPGMFGTTPEARAVQLLVESGKLTKEQGAAWLAGKPVTGPNGQVDFRTPLGTEQVRPAQLSQGEKDAILESDKAVEAGNASIGALTKALELNDQAFSGATAEARAWADRNVFPGEWGGTATTELQNLISTQALNSLRAIFGGNPTEGERKILLDLQASVNKSPEERKIILDNALAGAKARVAREQQRGQSMRSGTYFTQGLPQQTPGGGGGDTPAPNPTSARKRATNPQTGEVIEWDGSQWVPVK